jgi:cytochrome b
MTDATRVGSGDELVEVWDLPTRLFHWSLVALVVLAWLTGEEEGAAAVAHRYAGEAIAGLLVFRLAWGFVGGEHARFADFAAGPRAIWAHVRGLFSTRPDRHLGHNPLGGLAVFLLLLNVAVVVATGLFSGEEGAGGPFAGALGLELSEVHEATFRVLQALVVVHVAGVVLESWRTRDGLVPAMISGRKRRASMELVAPAKRASDAALLLAAALGLAAAGGLMALTQAGGLPPAYELDETDDD